MERSKVGRRSKRKGARGEREVATLLREAFPEHAGTIKRGFQSRYGGPVEPDVVFPGWHLEVKRQQRPNIKRALLQAERDCPQGPCAAITKEDGCDWIVSMRLGDWVRLVKGNNSVVSSAECQSAVAGAVASCR